jgi:hypothetical protein
MFVQGTYSFNGIPVVGTIGVVCNVFIRDPETMNFTLPLYTSAVQVDAQQPYYSQGYMCAYDPSGGDVFLQAYNYILTLPEFASFSLVA